MSFTTSVTSTSGTAADVEALAYPVALASGGKGETALVITTTKSATKHAPALPWKSGGVMLCVVLLGAPFTLRRRRAVAVLLAALAISMAGLLIACGGGSTSSTKVPPPITARTYTVTVTPTGTGAVTNPAPVSITVAVQ